MAFATTERGRHLARIFDEGMEEIMVSGKLQEIFDRYELPYPF